jgi:hypothetical protein
VGTHELVVLAFRSNPLLLEHPRSHHIDDRTIFCRLLAIPVQSVRAMVMMPKPSEEGVVTIARTSALATVSARLPAVRSQRGA